MDINVRPIQESDVLEYHTLLDAICRERRFLGALEAPPLESTRRFVSTNILLDHPQFIVRLDSLLVGWCDAVPGATASGHAHIGTLGMGIAKAYRRHGLGALLLRTVLDKARTKDLEKVELSVYSTNTGAIALYERFGFVEEGRRIRGRCVDGIYDDIVMMGLFLRE